MTKMTKAGPTPRLRFPEYRESQAWNEAKLGELVTTVTPPARLQTSNYMGAGSFPIVDQSQDQFCGWTDDARAVIAGPLPLVVFGDHTCALKIVRQPFAQGADGIKILRVTDLIDAEFLFQSLSHHPLEAEDYKRHFSALKERRVLFPDIKSGEQQRIVNCLTSLDDVIAAQARKVEALKAHKRGLMQRVFPREGETVPRLRFPEFRDGPAWNRAPLGDVADITLGKMLDTKKPKAGRPLPYINNLALRWGHVETSDLPTMYFSDEEVERYRLRAGDVLVCEGGEPGRSAVWDGRLPNVKFQKAVHRVRFTRPFEPTLLVAYLETIAGTASFEALLTGGGIKHLTRETFSRLAIPLPSMAEQQKIADGLATLNDDICAASQRLDSLRRHKAGLMQGLFPSPEHTS